MPSSFTSTRSSSSSTFAHDSLRILPVETSLLGLIDHPVVSTSHAPSSVSNPFPPQLLFLLARLFQGHMFFLFPSALAAWVASTSSSPTSLAPHPPIPLRAVHPDALINHGPNFFKDKDYPPLNTSIITNYNHRSTIFWRLF